MTLQVVTFDFWNTLVREDPEVWRRRLDGWKRILADAGQPTEDDAILSAFDKAWLAFSDSWKSNRMFDAADGLEVMSQHLGLKLNPELTLALMNVTIDPPIDQHPRLNPNVLECLEALKSADVKIGIICDVGLTPSPVLRRYLDQQGALEYFDHWSFSDEVGVFKPDERIFIHALEGLGGVKPYGAAHVGDLRRTDIAGGQAMGMTTVRYMGSNDDPPADDGPIVEGDHVVDDHALIPQLLGVV